MLRRIMVGMGVLLFFLTVPVYGADLTPKNWSSWYVTI